MALHHSLLEVGADFHLYIVAFDDACFEALKEAGLAHTTVISLTELENNKLLAVKQGRSVAEYCWTCTPSTIRYCIDKFQLNACTYVDADLYFYKDPQLLIDEMDDNDVLITPHNYHPKYDQSALAGIYCVQFVPFKNTPNGNEVLNWWVNACLQWCYARHEDGKMGDQKYLDSWPYMFDGVYICNNKYAGLAPWNALNYAEEKDVRDKAIFYHYHDLQYLSNGSWFLGGYDIPDHIVEQFYKPYISLLKDIAAGSSVVNSLNIVDAEKFNLITTKYKLGIYKLELQAAFKKFIHALFFINRRRFYKNNFIK
ncbi:glycosyl transferase [Mucilaginibacter myungsuensis]|uniref:Glycosyl transferase n=2 Tax=Mucilaginibacter myungsuensis TaxID=649104 RepID=A0A929KY92_9SPHI|nr:glycosyl transferase [Mucilaginibacter myungsuensis]MBE9660825.1 glycosyl transferase [Mucilaginibacter myungsuensis]